MNERIQAVLDSVQREENVRILFACESGSRAWGFPSADSDYDVRFIYAHPVEWYLRIDEGRDVIERPIDEALDLSGWDVRKALRLLRRSNGPLVEWLGSPIVYRQDDELAERMRALVPLCFQPVAAYHHYLNMARRIYDDSLQGETVSAKKYLYVLRPVLAMRWLERGLGVVPTEFDRLVEAVLDDASVTTVVEATAALIERKRHGSEADRAGRISPLHDFIDSELPRLSNAAPAAARLEDSTEALNEFFQLAIQPRNGL